MAFDYWFSWASKLQAGDELWYQRCEGGHVQACVVETCPEGNACWVEYYVKRPQGGRQHRRALVKLDELARIQKEHGELASDTSDSSESQSEADANCAFPSDDDVQDRSARERAISMVFAEPSEDEMSVEDLPRQRAFSMLFDDERTRAFSMLCASDDDLSERDFQTRSRAFSMLWSDELSDIPERSDESEQTESDAQQGSEVDGSRSYEQSEDDQRDECKSGGSQRSTASPESEGPESPVLGTYGEDDCLWPSAQWTLPELVGLEAEQVELFCSSAPEGCTNCCKPLVGHTVYKVEEELSELCRILQMKAAFLEAEDGELPSLEGDMKAWIYAEDPESEELDPCRAFTPPGSEGKESTDLVTAVAVHGGAAAPGDGEATAMDTAQLGEAVPRPKKKAGFVARAWAMLGCQSGAKAPRQRPEGTGSEQDATERNA